MKDNEKERMVTIACAMGVSSPSDAIVEFMSSVETVLLNPKNPLARELLKVRARRISNSENAQILEATADGYEAVAEALREAAAQTA